MDTSISSIKAHEILDSRGSPTLKVFVNLEDGSQGTFMVPSGASTGIYEAVELRDGDMDRYNGRGVLEAIGNVEEEIASRLKGEDALDQKKIDNILIELDGTKNKSNLGANAILGASVAVCKAAAKSQKRESYNYINSLYTKTCDNSDSTKLSIPIPLFNIMNGGAHADNNLSIQEFMVIPVGIETFKRQIQAGVEINSQLRNILKERGATTGIGDEGGFAPNLPNDETALDLITEAVERAGYKLDNEIILGLDIAASQYWEEDDKVYAIPQVAGKKVLVDKPEKIVEFYLKLVDKYPIKIIEDPLGENDWKGWSKLAKRLDFENKILVGDDLTVTNPERVRRAIKKKAINGLIIKPNQIGTLSEVFEVVRLCNENQITKIVSHRSGETVDTFLADLAVGVGSQYIKNGAPIRGERVAKYNRLLEISQNYFNIQQVSQKIENRN